MASIQYYNRVFPCKEGQTVLNVLLENEQDIPYSCKMGVRVTCVMQLQEGDLPTQEAFEAGASLVDAHVGDENQVSSSDPDKFAALMEGIEKHCPGMIFQLSTGGRGRSQDEHGKPLFLKPDMASLATGSVNFTKQIYDNHPELVDGLAKTMIDNSIKPEIEAFDQAMLYNTRR